MCTKASAEVQLKGEPQSVWVIMCMERCTGSARQMVFTARDDDPNKSVEVLHGPLCEPKA